MLITKDLFRTIIKEGQELIEEVNLYDRQFEFEDNGRYVMVGVRQAGKSYMLYKRAKQLMAEGHNARDFVYIDFDDERLINMKAEDFDLILQAYESTYGTPPILFFDEIQNVEGWEHFARRLANKKYQVYITGSNAKMLSRDIQTVLGSRYLEANVYPYSFEEYIGAQGLELSDDWEYGKEKMKVQQMFASYIKWGGFPELLLFANKRKWLNQLYDKILLSDVALRNKIKNELGLRLVYKRLAESMTKPVSFNRLSKLVNSVGVKTTPSSVIDYIKYGLEAFIIFALENYASKFWDTRKCPWLRPNQTI